MGWVVGDAIRSDVAAQLLGRLCHDRWALAVSLREVAGSQTKTRTRAPAVKVFVPVRPLEVLRRLQRLKFGYVTCTIFWGGLVLGINDLRTIEKKK